MMKLAFLSLFAIYFLVSNAFIQPSGISSHFISLSKLRGPLNEGKFPECSHLTRRTLLHMSSTSDDFYKGLDAYQILEIPRTADPKTIKSAYRKLVSTWHPDKFPDDEAKKAEGGKRMEAINRAWFCLGDDDRKRRYDQYGEAGVGTSAASEEQIKAAGGPGMGGFGGMGGQQVDVGDISDIFESFFGGGGGMGGGRPRQQKNPNAPVAGDDLQVEVDVPFMTSVFGGQEKMKVRRLEECGTCTGSGIKPGAKVRTCSSCNGKGVVNNMQRTPFGVFNNVVSCPNCKGSGQQVDEYCVTCKGKGSNSETTEGFFFLRHDINLVANLTHYLYKVVFKVPAGISAGTSLRIRGGGNDGRRGGPRGDLFVVVNVKRDPKYRREGIDVYTEEEISYADAILGATIKADTVDGKLEVKVPSGTQPEQRLRLRNKGIPKLGTPDFRGDQFITIKVKIPASVSGKEKELVEEIANLNKKKGGFFGGGV